jgi:hypothetical protein
MNKAKDTKNIVAGAVIAAGVAAAGAAALAHKPTRKKIIKGVRGALTEVQKRTSELGQDAKEQYEKTTDKLEKVIPKEAKDHYEKAADKMEKSLPKGKEVRHSQPTK